MKKIMLAVLAGALAVSAQAQGAEKKGQWYVAPMVSVIWTDGDRFTDDDVGGALSAGYAVAEDWNLELHAFGYQMDGANPTDLWGGGIDALRVFYRRSRITPFFLLGMGWDKKNRGFGSDSDAPYYNFGAGFVADITQSGSVALRGELRYRKELDDDTSYEDLVGNIGIQIPFGGAGR